MNVQENIINQKIKNIQLYLFGYRMTKRFLQDNFNVGYSRDQHERYKTYLEASCHPVQSLPAAFAAHSSLLAASTDAPVQELVERAKQSEKLADFRNSFQTNLDALKYATGKEFSLNAEAVVVSPRQHSYAPDLTVQRVLRSTFIQCNGKSANACELLN